MPRRYSLEEATREAELMQQELKGGPQTYEQAAANVEEKGRANLVLWKKLQEARFALLRTSGGSSFFDGLKEMSNKGPLQELDDQIAVLEQSSPHIRFECQREADEEHRDSQQRAIDAFLYRISPSDNPKRAFAELFSILIQPQYRNLPPAKDAVLKTVEKLSLDSHSLKIVLYDVLYGFLTGPLLAYHQTVEDFHKLDEHGEPSLEKTLLEKAIALGESCGLSQETLMDVAFSALLVHVELGHGNEFDILLKRFGLPVDHSPTAKREKRAALGEFQRSEQYNPALFEKFSRGLRIDVTEI